MKAVLVSVPRQKEQGARLVSHCRALGTDVHVFEMPDSDLSYPARNNFGFRQAALAMKGEAFFWLEPDSIPLVPGWLAKIEKEYVSSGLPFMLSRDSHPPHDLIGGIGVYGPETHKIIPETIPEGGWDGWLYDNRYDMIAWTPLIQHSYGIYAKDGLQCEPHMFPRDAAMLRKSAVIFHRDKEQGLIRNNQPEADRIVKTFFHTGDLW